MKTVWAIARNLITEILRMKALVVFIVALTIVYTAVFALWLHDSTGRADQKIQTFLSYSLSCTFALLSLLTIFISIASITRDIKRKEIFTITTKPVSRFCYLLGKLLGIAVFDLMLLIVSAGLIYGLTRLLQNTEPSTDDERNRLNELVLVARQAVKPVMPVIADEVHNRVEEIIAQKLRDEPQFYKNNPALINEMRHNLTPDIEKQFITAKTAVAPGGHIIFHFTDVNPVDRENGYVYIRYKADVSRNPEDLSIFGEWVFGPRDPVLFGGQMMRTKDAIRTVHEFAVPVSAVSDQGDLYVAFRNPTLNKFVSIIFPPDTGIEALYRVGGFEANFIRALIFIYLRLLFLALLGIAMGVWLSFPVGVLVILVVYVLGISSDFISDAMTWEAGEVRAGLVHAVMQLLPNFSAYDPIGLIEKGRLVSGNIPQDLFLALKLFIDNQPIPESLHQNLILFKDFIVVTAVAFVGYLIFKFRELARVII